MYKELIVEWLIMDDGSNDNTQSVVKSFGRIDNLEIKYYYQENQGKMTAINNLMEYVTGDLVLECDSDDCFSNEAFKTICEQYKKNKAREDNYAFLYLKLDKNNNVSGKELEDNKLTTMFDLYYKYEEDGEKALVFISKIRKKYKYELEKNERFITEASMFYRIDENYKILCINEPIMICEYQSDGYTKNIIKVFKENPYGYFKYFEYLLSRDLKEVKFNKKLYFVKHYILFSYLTKQRVRYRIIRSFKDKILLALLYIPGMVVSSIKFKTKV